MRVRTLQDVLNENGYINKMVCRKCMETLGYLDEDITWENRKKKGAEWEFYGYIECPGCGERTLVRVDRADIISRYNVAKYDTTYRK